MEKEKISDNHRESKTGLGVLCALFCGLIGLFIGLCSYNKNSYERKTFIDGWLGMFSVVMIIFLTLAVLYIFVFSSMVGSLF